MRLLGLPLCLASLLFSGCTALRADKEVRVDSTPQGCVVLVDGLLAGTTPFAFVLPRKGDIKFEVLPPRDNKAELFVQKKTVQWRQMPESGAVLYFDLRIDTVTPLQRYETRDR